MLRYLLLCSIKSILRKLISDIFLKLKQGIRKEKEKRPKMAFTRIFQFSYKGENVAFIKEFTRKKTSILISAGKLQKTLKSLHFYI